MRNLGYLCKFYILLLGLSILGMKPLFAETVNHNLIPTVPPEPKVPVFIPPGVIKLTTPQIPEDRGDPVENQRAIKIEGFKFIGNTVFSDRDIEVVLKDYIGRNLSFKELLQVRSLITKFYNEAGYVTSFAFLPKNQRIDKQGGIVRIQIVEGKLEKINIYGSSRLEKNVRSRLKKSTSGVLNRDSLLESLRLLQLDENIEKISSELKEGSGFGKAVLDVKVKASKAFSASLILNNYSSPTVGTFQRGIKLKHTSLLNAGDSLGFYYANTDGSNGYSLGYSIPVNNSNGKVSFSYTNISNNIIEEPFSDLDIVNDARTYGISFQQPIIRKINEEFVIGFVGERVESESYLQDRRYPLSEGADDEGRTKISVLRFFQDWISRKENTAFQLRSQFSLGTAAFDATVNSERPDSRFFSWLGQGAWIKRLGKNTLLLRGDLQLASTGLVPLEQVSLGGFSNVRGYRYSTYLSDNSLSLGAELMIPVVQKESSDLKIIPFIDFGAAWNNYREKDDRVVRTKLGSLLSLGLGVEYQLDKKLTTRLDWGIPLIEENNNNNSLNTWQENGIYFSLKYQLF